MQLKKDWMALLLLILGIALFLALAVYFDFTQDDAYITFRYAANFLNGDGLVYNVGEHIEGYTNFLWLITMILGGRAGIDFILLSKVLGVLCGAGTIVFTFLIGNIIFDNKKILAGLSTLILGTVMSFAYWSVAGLETAAFSLMTAAALYYYLKRSFLLIPVLAIATLLRPEGGLIAGIFVITELIQRRSLTKYILTILGGYIILLIPYAAFKIYYFGGLLPNPFYAKTGFDLKQFQNGLEYTGQFFWHYLAAGLFLIPALISFKKWNSLIKTLFIFLLMYVLYILLIGGDVLKVHRFFVPLFSALIIFAVYGLNRIFKSKYILFGSIVILIGWQLYMPREHVQTFHFNEKALNYKMDRMMSELLAVDSTDFSLATSTIGLIGYRLMGHDVIDLLGLTDSTVARHPEIPSEEIVTTWKETKYNSRYILSREPKYILFSTGFKPSAPAERALFLYSKFLNSYRTIGFYFSDHLQSIYKRYYPINGNIIRDVPPEFIKLLYAGIEYWGHDDYDNAIKSLQDAIRVCPDPKYPYLFYFISDACRKKGELEIAYNMLNILVKADTLVFEAAKDMYLYEDGILRNKEMADYYFNRVAKLAPWYIPRIESLAATLRSEYPEPAVVDSTSN